MFLQAALLYTTVTGERRVRVHNMRLQATESSHEVFRHTDIDALLALYLRRSEWRSFALSLRGAKQAWGPLHYLLNGMAAATDAHTHHHFYPPLSSSPLPLPIQPQALK